MKICVIGDPHGGMKTIKKIPLKNVDIIIITGDLGKADLARKRFFANQERKQKGLSILPRDKKFVRALYKEIHSSTVELLRYLQKFAPVYTLQGNVGIATRADVKKNKRKGITIACTLDHVKKMKRVSLVKNQIRLLDGLRVGFLEFFMGTSWVREFKPKNYREQLAIGREETKHVKKILARFGKTDIFVCHQPPYGYLDKVTNPAAPKLWQGKHAGSKAILQYIKKYQPKYVFCGHIHEGEGSATIGKTKVYNLGVAKHKIISV